MRRDTKSPGPGWRYGGLAAAVLIAALLQGVIAARSPIIARDGMLFVQIAQQLDNATVMFRSQSQHPGYPALIASAHHVANAPDSQASWIAAARWASGICGVLCVVVLWLLTRRIFGPSCADVAAFLTAGLPLLRQNAADALSDSPHLLFYACAAWLFCEAQAGQRLVWFVGAGVASGLAFWIRPEGWSVAIIASAWLLMAMFRATPERRPRLAVAWSLLVVATLLVSAPYLIVAGKITSKITEKENLAALQRNDPPNKVGRALLPVAAKPGKVAAKPGKRALPTGKSSPAAHLMVGQFGKTAVAAVAELATEAVQRLHILLLFAGCAVVLRGRALLANRGLQFVLALALFHASLLILLYFLGGYIDQRHLMPLSIAVIPLAAVGLTEVAHRAAARWRASYVAGPWLAGRPRLWVVGGVTLLILGMMPRCVRPLHREFHAHHAAGVWLQTQIELGDRVLTNSPYVSFYAQKRATWLADDDLSRPPSRPELVAPGRTFVVIDTSRTSSIDSQWLAPHGVHCVGQQTFSTVLRGERRDVFLSELQTMSKRRFARRS